MQFMWVHFTNAMEPFIHLGIAGSLNGLKGYLKHTFDLNLELIVRHEVQV